MTCCLIAAFLIAQAVAMLRRWGVFWGVLPVPEGEVADTIFTRALGVLRRPGVRAVIVALVAVELSALGSWLYFEHGTHLTELADQNWSRLHGERVVYADWCGSDGEDRVRIVLNDTHEMPLRRY